jgi:hypothetical protein
MALMLAVTWRMAVSLPGALAVVVGSVAEVVAGCLVAGGGSSFLVSPKEVSPQKTPFEEHPMVINTTTLPSAVNAYMNYTKHVNAGLAGEAWRLQTRHCDCNKRVNGDSEALEGGERQNVAHAYVLDGNKGGKMNTTGTITPDVTL